MSFLWTRWRDWPLGFKGAAVVALPIVLLLAMLYSNYSLQRDVSRADEDVQRTLRVRGDIQALHTLIAEAASGVRGFLLTGREEFLSPFWMAKDRIPRTEADLRMLIADPEQARQLEIASQLVATKLASLDKLRIEGAQLEPDALQSHLRTSKAVLDNLRTQIAVLADREAQLLAQRTALAARARRRELLANVAMAIVGLGGAGIALWMLSSGIIRRVQTAATNAERLASGLPLMAPPVAGDEVGQLAERLHRASLLLAERAEQAQAANRAKTEFLSRTSHELRTPLNVILGFAQLLEADVRGTPSATSVAQVLGAGRHLLALIDEMLDIARIESGELKLETQRFELSPMLREVCTLVAPLAASSNVTIDMLDSTGIAVRADPQRLLQVLLNLLTNAVKYNRVAGSVRVTAEHVGTMVRIAVADTGVGIAPEQQAKLFSPFERLDAGRSKVEGTGLGLAISRQLMKRMGGTIDVQSELGRGSVFTLELPAGEGPVMSATGAATQPVRTRVAAAQYELLYIEDNESNIALLRALLAKRPQWHLRIALRGDEGLRTARESLPQLILLDLHLPDLTGESVLAALRGDSRLSQIPVAILSADALPATIERLQAAGATDYLTKPIDVPRINALLDRFEI
jgi:signal transduction histidine kinase